MKHRLIGAMAVLAVALPAVSAQAQVTKSVRLQTRLPRATVDPDPSALLIQDPSPLGLTTVGTGFFAGKSPTVFGNQPHADSRVVRAFEGLSDYDTRLMGRALVPPDTMGAVGTTQFVQLINGGFGVFSKSTGALLGATTDASFWSQLGQIGTGGDPRILFNHQQQRWIAIGFGANTKDLNIAVSDTADALGGWKATRFQALAPLAAGAQTIADYPTLAMDNNAVYIGTNNFAASCAIGCPTNYRGTSLFVLPTAEIFQAGGPSLSNIKEFKTTYDPLGVNDTTKGYAIQGVNSNEATDGKGHIVAASAFINGVLSYDVNNAGTAGATLSATTFLDTGYDSNAAARQPGRPDATNPGSLRNIDTLDDRIASNAWEVNGKTYFVHTITRPGEDQTTLRVMVIDSNTKAVIQTLDIGEAGYDYYQGSMAVSAAGRAMVAYNRSGTNPTDGRIGLYARTFTIAADGTLVGFNTPILIRSSDTPGYLNGNTEKSGLPAGRQRWGDYAAVTLDPTNPFQFWTIGQYARAAYETQLPGYPAPSGFSRWGQYIAAVDTMAVPEPAVWAQLIAGFGLIGAVARVGTARRRRAAA